MAASLLERDLVSSCLQLDSEPNGTALPFRQALIDVDVGQLGTCLWGCFITQKHCYPTAALGEGGSNSVHTTAWRKWSQEGQLAEAVAWYMLHPCVQAGYMSVCV